MCQWSELNDRLHTYPTNSCQLQCNPMIVCKEPLALNGEETSPPPFVRVTNVSFGEKKNTHCFGKVMRAIVKTKIKKIKKSVRQAIESSKKTVLPHVMSEKATQCKCCNFHLHPSEQTSVRVQTETSTSGAQGP